MRKLLQFLSIGILSSSAITSVTACNNKQQKADLLNQTQHENIKKEIDEQLKKIEENQNQISEIQNKKFEHNQEEFIKENESLDILFKNLSNQLETMNFAKEINNFESKDLYEIALELQDIIKKITKSGQDLQDVKKNYEFSEELTKKWEDVFVVFKKLKKLAEENLQFVEEELNKQDEQINGNPIPASRTNILDRNELDGCNSEQNFNRLKDLEAFNDSFKATVKKYNFYIKDDAKNMSKEERKQQKSIIINAFSSIKKKVANEENYHFIPRFVFTKTADQCKISYILENYVTNESVISKEDSIFIKVDKILINEFKSKLREKLLKSKFQVVKKQIGINEKLRNESLRRQVREIITELNKEEKYNFSFKKIQIISVERDSKFNLNINFSKVLPNSLCNLNLESFFIFLPFEFK